MRTALIFLLLAALVAVAWPLWSDRRGERVHALDSHGPGGTVETRPEALSGPADRLPAFPGAEGFGATSRGGRGGTVYTVTNLAEAGVGSLRWALTQPEPRTVVFAVSGVIALRQEIAIDDPYLTVAGQTAPSGITLQGARLKVRTHDVILRGLRVRPGDGPFGMRPADRDGLSIGSKDRPVHDVIVDHCSFTWAVDENGSNWHPNQRVTIQWSIFAEGLRSSIHPEGDHSMGYLIGPGSEQVTLHHNLFAHNEHRNPAVADARGVEIINNVGYNWRSEGLGVTSLGRTTLHALDNAYVHGADSLPRPAFYLRPSLEDRHALLLRGNIDSVFRQSADSGSEWDVAHGWRQDMRAPSFVFHPSGVRNETARSALEAVLAAAGAIAPSRDAIDARIVASVRTRSGRVIDSPGDVPDPQAQPGKPAPLDTDHDGLPDDWEVANALDPSDATDSRTDRDGDGYTALETYLNELIETRRRTLLANLR